MSCFCGHLLSILLLLCADDVGTVLSTLRFLVSNNCAGSVIGRGGQVISEFQAQSGAKIVMSRTKEFFPGTGDRIILLTGTVSAILTALHLIMSKLSEVSALFVFVEAGSFCARDAQHLYKFLCQDGARDSVGRDPNSELRIVVPNKACGAVIGKGGATIR